MFSESGTVEIEARLPCNHTFGSACIVRWLQNSNTCPICREAFIPLERRPSIEPPIMDGRESIFDDDFDDDDFDDDYFAHDYFDDDDSDEEYSWDLMTVALHTYTECCDALRLRSSVRNLVQKMIRTGDSELNLLFELGAEGAVAVCIFMASILLRHHISSRGIGRAANTSRSYMRDAYKEIYTYQRELLEENWVDGYGHGDLESALGLLPPPSGSTVIEWDT